MGNILRLVKVNLSKFASGLNVTGKVGKKKSNKAMLFVAMGVMFASFFMYAFAYGTVLQKAGCAEMLVIFGLLGGGIMSFITSITSSQSYIYSSSDTDLLLSLPLKKSEIVISKVLSLYFATQFTSLLVMIPFGVVYAILVNPPLSFYLVLVLAMLVSDLLFIALGMIVGFFVGLAVNGSKNKTIIQTVLTFVLVFGFIFAYTRFTSSISVDVDDPDVLAMLAQSMENLKNVVATIFPPVYFTYHAMSGELLNILWLVLVSIGPIALEIALIQSKYTELITLFNKQYRNKNYKYEAQGQTNVTKALIKKDLKMIFSSSGVAMNTVLSPVMTTVMMLIMIFTTREVEDIKDLYSGVPYFMIIFSSIYTLGGCLISLEGPQFEILKLSPIPPRKILIAKTRLSFFLAMPFAVVNGIVIFLLSGFDYFSAIMTMIPSMGAFYFATVIGLYINIKKPYFNWDNPIRAAKQSISVLLTMLFGFIYAIVNIITIVLVRALLGDIVSICWMVAFALISGAIARKALLTKGAVAFSKIEL